MEVFSDLSQNNKNLALALGFFDGVHLGHQAVIKSAVDYAKKKSVKSAVITFKEHPQVLLQNVFPEYITSLEKRRQKLQELGVDICYELDFNTVSSLTGLEYLQDFLVKNVEPVSISTGFNHYFGMQKTGSAQMLEDNAEKFGYEYFKIAPVSFNNKIVSSSVIRKCLASGNVELANKMLGSNFSICGIVQKGANIASKLGFKTANLFYPKNIVKIPFGVYALKVKYDGVWYKAIANFGVKPTFNNLTSEPVLEVHILNFDKEIYGELLEVEFLRYLREEKKYSSVEDLKKQIVLDIEQLFE